MLIRLIVRKRDLRRENNSIDVKHVKFDPTTHVDPSETHDGRP